MTITINQTMQGLLIRDGSIVRTLGTGTYRTSIFRNETITTYPAVAQAYGYSVNTRTKEGVTVTIDVTLDTLIDDVEKLHLSGKGVYDVVSRAVTKQVQTLVATMTLNDVLETLLTLDGDMLSSEIHEYGLSTTVMLVQPPRLPRNLQNAIDAQEVARQRAKAELEEARGRSAVIRHYANTAKVTKDNPDLLRLLLGQKAKSINVAFDAAGKAAR